MRTDDLSYHYFGLYIGTVLSVDDPENLGRLRIDTDQYADGEGTEAIWAPVARPAAGSKTGIFFTPKPGDQVIVGYLAGDVEQPVVFGYAHSSSEPPPEQGAKDKQAIVTGIGSVVFDESGGSITVTLKGPPSSSVKLDMTGVHVAFGSPAESTVDIGPDGVSIASATKIQLAAPALVFAGYPSFGPPLIPGVAPPTTPVEMDFRDVGLAIRTGSKEFCVNEQGVALEKFVADLYNQHTHSPGPKPDLQWSETTDTSHDEVSLCEGP